MSESPFKYPRSPGAALTPQQLDGSRSYWELLAAKLEREPGWYAPALETCERWLREGHAAEHRLEQWRVLLREAVRCPIGRNRVCQILRSEDPQDTRLREFNPFAGILTREERRQAAELCGYRH